MPTSASKPSRLHEQGFVNLHRKLLFRLAKVALVAYWLLVPTPWKLPGLALPFVQMAGMLLIFAGILGRMLSTISIGGHKDRTIVKTELYSICRNPLYFASFLLTIGVGLLSTRMDFMLLTGACYLAIFYPMMLNEANFLRRKFEDFADYEKKVPLFFPNFTLWNSRKAFEINFVLVMRTLLDSSLTLLAIPVVLVATRCA